SVDQLQSIHHCVFMCLTYLRLTPSLSFIFHPYAPLLSQHSFPTRRSSDLFVPEHGTMFTLALVRFPPTATKEIQYLNARVNIVQIGRAVQQECRDRYRMQSSA